MQLIVIASLIASVLAMPGEMASRQNGVCQGGLYTSPQCCTPNIDGVACLDASVPSEQPQNAAQFRRICAKEGKGARCCAVPAVGLDLLCEDAV